jgi:DNA invertase Pin-like site-specific DNA recombinase
MSSALVYVRQSRHKEGEHTVSPEVQEQQCRRLPAVAACDQVEVFPDLDVSGGKLKGRKQLARLLDRIEAGGVGVVAAYDQSRAFRNTADALSFYALMEKHTEIEVAFVQGRFDRSPVGEFSYTTLAAAHAMERRMTGEKIAAAYHHSAEKGTMVGQVPAGYSREPAADGSVTFESRIVIDEAVAATVRRIFTEYASGSFSTREIARRLNAEGVPPLPRSRGAGWRFYSVAELLRNVAYTGQSFKESRRRHGKGALMVAKWPAIIEPELWQAAQRQFKRYTGRGGRRPRGQERPYIFRGLLRCSCGAKLYAAFRNGQPHYLCPRTDDAQRCLEPRTPEANLIPWARALFEQLEKLTPADFADQVAALASQPEHTSPNALQAIERSLERAQQLFLWGEWSAERYQSERSRLLKRRAELLATDEPPAGIQLRGLLQTWDLGDHIARRELLATLFDALHVSGEQITGYSARADREGAVLKIMEALRYRVINVGGDGLEPTASSV